MDLPKAIEFSETDFFDTLTIQNDQISYVKHVFAHLYVFFTPFGCCWGGVAPKGSSAQLAQEWLSLSPLRGALPKAIEFLFRPVCVH